MSASETLEVMRDNKEETKKSAAAEAKRRRMVSGARNNVSFSRALSRAALRSLTAFEGLFVFAGRDFAGDFYGLTCSELEEVFLESYMPNRLSLYGSQ